MHSLFGITFVLFLLKLSAGKGFWKKGINTTANITLAQMLDFAVLGMVLFTMMLLLLTLVKINIVLIKSTGTCIFSHCGTYHEKSEVFVLVPCYCYYSWKQYDIYSMFKF
jgi:hypothetical protein